jgi:hypothetical protein
VLCHIEDESAACSVQHVTPFFPGRGVRSYLAGRVPGDGDPSGSRGRSLDEDGTRTSILEPVARDRRSRADDARPRIHRHLQFEIVEELGGRGDAADQQVIAGAGAGDVEQVPLGAYTSSRSASAATLSMRSC